MAAALTAMAGTEERAIAMLLESLEPYGSEVFDQVVAKARADGVPHWEIVGDLDEVAPGILGDVVERGGTVFVNILWSEDPGKGNVTRWLDSLRGRRVICPAVISRRFALQLERHGFTYHEASGGWQRDA